MHELIRLQKQWNAAWGRLANKGLDRRGTGAEPESEYRRFANREIGWAGPFGKQQGDLARSRRRTLAKLIDLTSASRTERLHVEGLTPVSAMPPVVKLVHLAEIARPTSTHTLGLQRAMLDLKLASEDEPSITDDHLVQQPSHIKERPEIALAKLSARQSESQRVALGDSIRQEVEQRHREAVSSLEKLRELATEIEKKRRWYQVLERKYEDRGMAPANEVGMTLAHLQKLELREWGLLVEHRQSLLALNTAVGVRLFP